MISQETIDEIVERASLVEVVGESVVLKRQGASYVGLCPFHGERTPSFHVRDNDRFFHCFGCGESGNVIKFVMAMRALSFPEAVEELAGRFGIRIKHEGRVPGSPEPKSQKPLLFRINALAQEYFRRALERAEPEVLAYIRSRNVSQGAIDAFGLGYAPKLWGGLVEFLRSQKISEELILSAGLARRNSRGELNDLFRGRLMFPIWIDNRRIAGFGGRVIPPLFDAETLASFPKYLNSPETPIYQKTKIFYGLPQAVPAAREQGFVILVEGYLDVVGLAQVGVSHVVATCGTALTDQHVRRLAHVAQRLLVLFDGDDAGRSAAGKSFSTFINSGIDVEAGFLPDGEDPDTIAEKQGAQTSAYLAALPRKPLFDCYVDFLLARFDAKSAKDLGAAAKGKLAIELASTLAKVTNAIEQASYLERASFLLKIESAQLRSLVRERGGHASQVGRAPAAAPSHAASRAVSEQGEPQQTGQSRVALDSLPRLDRELLLAVMAKKETLAAQVLADRHLSLGVQPATRSFIEALSAIVGEAGQSDGAKKERIKTLLREFGESWVEHWRKAYLMVGDREVDLVQVFEQCRSAVIKAELNQAIKRIDRDISESEQDEAKARLVQERILLSRRLSELGGRT